VVSGPGDVWGDGGPPPSSAGEAVGRLWRVGREAAEKKRQVIDAVRLAREGKTRDELRSDFEAELARRRMSQDPIWVERTLDELEQSPAAKIQQKAQNVLLVGSTLGRIARSRGIPDPPEWMNPPDEASYYGPPRRGDKVPIEVDRGSVGWLDRALESAPGRVGDVQAVVPVWFDWDTGQSDPRCVAVYIGSTRVGALDRKASESFASVMKAAEERGGKPRGMSALARARHLDPPYLLVVDLPEAEGN
jgi:hypothetical protein